MEALLGLLALLFKIAIQASLYATVVVLVGIVLGKLFPKSPVAGQLKYKRWIWLTTGCSISVIFLVYSFTFWGDRGLGDSARIPLSYFREIDNTNWMTTSIDPENYAYGSVNIGSFTISNDHVVGTTEVSPVDRPLPYFRWDLKTNKVKFFKSEDDYIAYATTYNLPSTDSFQSFSKNYGDHWYGWRIWLLP